MQSLDQPCLRCSDAVLLLPAVVVGEGRRPSDVVRSTKAGLGTNDGADRAACLNEAKGHLAAPLLVVRAPMPSRGFAASAPAPLIVHPLPHVPSPTRARVTPRHHRVHRLRLPMRSGTSAS